MGLLESGYTFSGPIEDEAAYLFREDRQTGRIVGVLIIPREELQHFYSLLGIFPDLEYITDETSDPHNPIDEDPIILQGFAHGNPRHRWVQVNQNDKRLPLEQRRHFVFGIRGSTGDIVALPSEKVSIPTIYQPVSIIYAENIERGGQGEDEKLSIRKVQKTRLATIGLDTNDLFRARGGKPEHKLKQFGGWFGIPPDSERTREDPPEQNNISKDEPDDIPWIKDAPNWPNF